jgi:hypothetical protein
VAYGLGGEGLDGGQVFVREVSSGDTLWVKSVDPAEAKRVFGGDVIEPEMFQVRKPGLATADLDGDGVSELVAEFGHVRFYPNVTRIYRSDGSVKGTYFNKGFMYGIHVEDLDADDKDEIILAGTNNCPGYQGGTLVLLDDAYCNGASRDSLCLTECPLSDSSKVRVVFPHFDERYMTLLGTSRLHCMYPMVQRTHDGKAVISCTVADDGGDFGVLVTLDTDLRPLSVHLTDAAEVAMRTWPSEDAASFKSGYLDEWLRGAVRFGAASDSSVPALAGSIDVDTRPHR